MLVRIVKEYRRGEGLWLPGQLLPVDDQEAAELVENGWAVPYWPQDDLGRETRRKAYRAGINRALAEIKAS